MDVSILIYGVFLGCLVFMVNYEDNYVVSSFFGCHVGPLYGFEGGLVVWGMG